MARMMLRPLSISPDGFRRSWLRNERPGSALADIDIARSNRPPSFRQGMAYFSEDVPPSAWELVARDTASRRSYADMKHQQDKPGTPAKCVGWSARFCHWLFIRSYWHGAFIVGYQR